MIMTEEATHVHARIPPPPLSLTHARALTRRGEVEISRELLMEIVSAGGDGEHQCPGWVHHFWGTRV